MTLVEELLSYPNKVEAYTLVRLAATCIQEHEREIATLKQKLSKYEAAGVNLNARVAELAVLKQQNAELLSALRTCKSSTKYNLQEELVTTYYFDITKVVDAIASAEGK
jgi:hypothetical protein